jgi:hypothetical protein
MERGLYSVILYFGIFIALLMTPQRLQAALGENTNSVESDRRAISAARENVSAFSNYTVHAISSHATTIREYVSQDGIVFGVAWNGLIHPDLTPLLGSYAGEYREALLQAPRLHGRRHFEVKAQHVVVEKWGHMRNHRGRAYIPSLMPTGVSTDDIK